MLISIKRFLDGWHEADQPPPDLLEAFRQMGRVLLDGIAAHAVRGRPADLRVLRRAMQSLARSLEQPQDALGPLAIASEAIEALETYRLSTSAYLDEADQQLRSMLSMLTETIAELSDQTDSSVSRLQVIEKQILQATELDDTRILHTHLATCLAGVRDAAAQQKSSSAGTLGRLQHHVAKSRQRDADRDSDRNSDDDGPDLVPESFDDVGQPAANCYVAAFKLQRAEHIASRFGENAKRQLLSLIGNKLKEAVGPADRLMRWRGQSFVIFLSTSESIAAVRTRLSEIVTAAGQQYIEVGRKSAMLSVGIDWILFPQAQYPTLEAVFAELDNFLDNAASGPQGPSGRMK